MLHGIEFLLLVVASTVIDAAVAWIVLFARWERLLPKDGEVEAKQLAEGAITVSRVVLATVLTSCLFLLKLPILIFLGLTEFGLVYLAYVDLVILLPLTGLLILVAGRWRRRSEPLRVVSRGVTALALLALGLVPVGVYATFIEPFRLQIETATIAIPPRRSGESPIRIGVLADIQTAMVTEYEHGAVDRLMELEPDLILLPGDLYQGPPELLEARVAEFRELLGKLSAPGGVYFVLGNMDAAGPIRRLIEGTAVELLVNQHLSVSIKDRVLTIGGVELFGPPRFDRRDARRFLEEFESVPGNDDYRILIAHYPDTVLFLPDPSRIDLVVAGHTHGGQVSLPFFGPPLTLSRAPRDVCAGGYHELGGRRIYVSRGVGCERGQAPRIRFLCPPEVSILELR